MIELDKKLHKEIKEYCQLNGMVMKEYVNSLLKKAFIADKFGDTPFQRGMEDSPIVTNNEVNPKPIKTEIHTVSVVTENNISKVDEPVVIQSPTTEENIETNTLKKPKKRKL
jgi:hypothetical protein